MKLLPFFFSRSLSLFSFCLKKYSLVQADTSSSPFLPFLVLCMLSEDGRNKKVAHIQQRTKKISSFLLSILLLYSKHCDLVIEIPFHGCLHLGIHLRLLGDSALTTNVTSAQNSDNELNELKRVYLKAEKNYYVSLR